MSRAITILDTTLRDGALTPGVQFSLANRLEIAGRLADLGVDVVEVAAPASAPDELQQLAVLIKNYPELRLCVLLPCDFEALRRTIAAVGLDHHQRKLRFHLYCHPFGQQRHDELAKMVECVCFAAAHTKDVQFSALNGMQGDFELLLDSFRRAVECGATTLGLADTAGRCLPDQVATRVTRLRAALPKQIALSFHGHNDLGLATANTWAAILAGAEQFEASVNGLGPRAGNTALEQLARLLSLEGEAHGLHTAMRVADTGELRELSELVVRESGVPVSDNSPLVGRAVRTVAS